MASCCGVRTCSSKRFTVKHSLCRFLQRNQNLLLRFARIPSHFSLEFPPTPGLTSLLSLSSVSSSAFASTTCTRHKSMRYSTHRVAKRKPLSLLPSRQMMFISSVLLLSLLHRRAEAFVPLPKSCPRMVPLSGAATSDAAYSHVKGVIFDVDGTLADSWKLGFDATVVVLEKNNVPLITEDEYHDYTRYATPERLARHAGLTPSDNDFAAVGKRLGDEFDDLYVGLVTTETAGFYPGISSMLSIIPENVALGALTNACVGYAHAVLKTNCPVASIGVSSEGGIYSRFQSIRGADNVPTPKPSPDGLFEVCNDLQLKPQECIYIGDSPSDAAAAKAAGMCAVGVLWGSHAEEKVRAAPFDHVCRSVEELKALMPKRITIF